MKRYLIPAVIVALLAGFVVWWLSPVQVVTRRTKSLLSAMTLQEGRGKASSTLSVYSLNPLIAKELILETPTISQANGTFDRSEIESGFSWLANQGKFTKFKIEELRSVTINGDRATVDAKIEGVVVLSEMRPADGLYDVELDWIREDDGWRLSKAKWIEAR